MLTNQKYDIFIPPKLTDSEQAEYKDLKEIHLFYHDDWVRSRISTLNAKRFCTVKFLDIKLEDFMDIK